MATIALDQNYPVGIQDLDLNDLGKVTDYEPGKSSIRLEFGSDDSITFKGSNFDYKNGAPYDGMVRGFYLELDDKQVLRVTGLHVDVADVAKIIKSGDYNKLFALGAKELGGDDYFGGSAGRDVFDGGAGNDRIAAHGGNDRLTGGTGKDSFLFNTKLGSNNVDYITDFSHKDDTIQLSHSLARISEGTLKSSAFKEVTSPTSKSVDSSDRILYDRKDGDIYFDRDGSGDKYDAIRFATVKDGLMLDHTDFLIV